MKYISLFFLIAGFMSCSHPKQDGITNSEDYDRYLVASAVDTTSKYFELWNSKIKSDSIQLVSFGIVAGEYGRYFQKTGDIRFLKKAEQALKKATDIAAIGRAGYYRALARNYISQHRFKEALEVGKKAYAVGNGLDQTKALLFDIHMELGNYETARAYLDSIGDFKGFDFLIRLAKWKDHKGDLSHTIRLMEDATTKAELSKNKDLMLWSYTNIADYYGHAGNIRASYEYYLKSLQLDPGNAYAKKGIAWIVYSHEKNPVEALRILNSVTESNKSPDYHLLKAEIADYMGDTALYRLELEQYTKEVAHPFYGQMYNVYTIDFHLNESKQYKKALHLAQQEVDNRPTPESYSLLAYAYFKKGEPERAVALMKEHVEGKTFEPTVLLRSAEIYKATGNTIKAESLKEMLMETSYELGPSTSDKIASL
ncbi:tetratricopeptide repeat protein [Flavobacteriaceae bacterium TP-CH-4]|uniref:Tetratricopeptide repeat protein n=2 Tax=Pelagihabitans pacificus TaxID=2696054 RepID=A0A967AXR3_9FLAO|nr:tetratricopeptide repeat protein [Pelagihabitans pacificus]